MKVREVMKSPVVSISPDTTYEEAARIMYRNRFSGLPVVDPAGQLLGLVSEKDLFKALYPDYSEFIEASDAVIDQESQESEIERLRSKPVSLYMSRKVFVISPDAPVLKAGGLMLAHGLHRLPVIEDGVMIGIVTRREIYGRILRNNLALGHLVSPVHDRKAGNF